MLNDHSSKLQQQVKDANANKSQLRIEAGKSKLFYGNPVNGDVIDIRPHQGIISYEPSELVIKVKAGTALSEIETTLAEQQQCLPFEPPHFGTNATIGGTIACGFSGPARPFRGSLRDHVLGCTVLTGKGDILHFGGEVMKNVAGYDVSRLMAGSLGTLGILLDVSLRVAPASDSEITLQFNCDVKEAMQKCHAWCAQALSLSAVCYTNETLYVRLSGSGAAIASAQAKLGGIEAEGSTFWNELNEHQLPFFNNNMPLWRVSVAATSHELNIKGESIIDWAGAQHWITSSESENEIRNKVEQLGGHANLFRNGDENNEALHPLNGKLKQLHLNLKQVFDPFGILNFGRMYTDI
jgi:glycolate oxidase FAD binding subunit